MRVARGECARSWEVHISVTHLPSSEGFRTSCVAFVEDGFGSDVFGSDVVLETGI